MQPHEAAITSRGKLAGSFPGVGYQCANTNEDIEGCV
jgi:hypothetical protein